LAQAILSQVLEWVAVSAGSHLLLFAVMGGLAGAAVLLFNFLLVLCTVPSYLLAKFAVLSARVKPLHADSCRRRAVLVSTCLAWRFALLCCCWIRVKVEGLPTFQSAIGKSGRSPVVVANHASFMDTILLVTFMPLSQIGKTKMFVSSHLLSMPLLGTIVAAMGHLAVPFKSTAAGKFEVDRERMAERMQELEAHVKEGGVAGWYPEGTMNRADPREIQAFRAGGFALAVHLDVEVWCVAFQGNAVCWPASAPVGGRPARIGVDISQLCKSSHAHIADGNVDLSEERAACILLATAAQERVQQRVTELVDGGYGAAPDISKPLLQ